MKMKRYPFLLLPLLIAVAGCGGKTVKLEAAAAHEEWLASLNDSIDRLRTELDSANVRLAALRGEMLERMEMFEHVDNPRYVEGFTIRKGWASRYPLSSTGIVARMTEGEAFELVAALSGGTFDRITVSSGSESRSTSRVPYDKAFNYRSGQLNTVAFSDAAADSVGMLVAAARGPVTVTYEGGGRPVTRTMTDGEREMIAATWQLIGKSRESHRIERSLPVLQEKIKIFQQKAPSR